MSQVNRCEAITNSGEQCSRNSSNNQNYCTQHLNNLTKLPKDIFSVIGKYTTFAEAKELKEEYPEAKNIGFQKDCAVIGEYTPEILEELYQISPNIKSLEIYFGLEHLKIYKKVDLSVFKKLENLKSNIIPDNFRDLKTLKSFIYINDYIPQNEIDKILISSKLQYLEIPWILLKSDALDFSKWIKVYNLKELVIERYPIHYLFPHLRRLVFIEPSDLNENTSQFAIETVLKVLTIPNKIESLELIRDFLPEDLLNSIYTKNLKHLEIPADLYGGINQLDLPNLEYLSLNNDSDLEMSYLKILELPKLKYLEFIDLKITKNILNLITQLKTKIPNLQLNVTHGFHYKKKYYDNIIAVSKLFTLNLNTEITEMYNSRYIKILESKFAKAQWLADNGFYVSIKCNDVI